MNTVNGTNDFFKELTFGPDGIRFAVFSPDADEVELRFYQSGEGGEAVRVCCMEKDADGRWRVMCGYEVNNLFYTFKARVNGLWREESPGLFATAVGVNGQRGFVTDIGKLYPEGWQDDRCIREVCPEDAVIYEMHHRDFSASSDSGMVHKGKFLALTEKRTFSPEGAYTGLSHLITLGVTHVHILPSFDFASVDERTSGYNWGYDPLNYNVPEGSYATDPYEPSSRIREFREMVMALHRAGLRVVLDVVYNHTYTIDGSNFERLVPGYFFRKKPDGEWADGSGCGNETASEKPFMRQFMLESVLFWQREYHIDGFRFDVMGLHDIATMQMIRDALQSHDPLVLLYGEGWSTRPAQLPVSDCALKCNMERLDGIGAFGDELRDGLRGLWTSPVEGGFLSGQCKDIESVRFGIVGGVYHPQVNYDKVNHSRQPWAGRPSQMINYISCHDDWCLTDRLRAVCSDLSDEERRRLYLLGETILMTSQGVPLIFAGDEFCRSKHGERNSYKTPDSVNAIVWKAKDNYASVFHYMCELIRLRETFPAFRLRTAEEVRRQLLFLPAAEGMLAYTLRDHDAAGSPAFYLFFNPQATARHYTVPRQNYLVLCRDGNISLRGLGHSSGGKVYIAPRSALILRTL